MAGSKTTDRVCCLAVAVMLILTAVIWTGKAASGKQSTITVGYEGLFDTGYVHTIDIEIADWDSMIAEAMQETYTECSVTIDGEKVSNVGIRAKGNTSLSSVASMGSEKYSFKIEFDQFVKGKTYHGLDKLSLNNLIYDATMMKDYLAYTLMNRAGVPASLCSYVQITVNGEPWGLYLAVEGVENAFMERNNMTTGELYKPDSMSFGGGRGNGRDFDFEQFRVKEDEDSNSSETDSGSTGSVSGSTESGSGSSETVSDSAAQTDESGNPFGAPPGGFGSGIPSGIMPPDGMSFPGNFQMPEGMSAPEGFDGPESMDTSEGLEIPEGMTAPEGFRVPGSAEEGTSASRSGRGDGFFQFGGGMFNFGMGSSDVKLQYIDDDPDSYANIFSNAKTDIGKTDQARLIEALKTLNGDHAQDAVYTDEVIRYLAVHDFLQNDDSYTGMMVHNYYLYEEDSRLAILPWDYNLAFGGMGGGSDASSTVNSPIDTPVSNSIGSDRPLISWILQDEESLAKYHEVYSQFIADTVESGWLADEITRVAEMIRSCVQEDENSFFSVEEFDKAVEALQSYCALRGESVRGQLDGTIPSTSEGQRADSSALVDAGTLNISDMGVMNTGGGGPGGGNAPSMPGGSGAPAMPDGNMPSSFSGARIPSFGSDAAFSPSSDSVPSPFSGTGMPSSGADDSFSPPADGALPSFSGGQRPSGPQEIPGGGFPGEQTDSSVTQQTAWSILGSCLVLLLAALLITVRLKGHNE